MFFEKLLAMTVGPILFLVGLIILNILFILFLLVFIPLVPFMTFEHVNENDKVVWKVTKIFGRPIK